VTTMLRAVIVTADPDERAILWQRPQAKVGGPADFAARGGLELILHAYDVCTGLGVAYDPPRDLCDRLWNHTGGWPGQLAVEPSGDRWSDLLARSGRPRP